MSKEHNLKDYNENTRFSKTSQPSGEAKSNGKKKALGTFDTAIAAALAYDQAAIKAGRKSHTLNFPEGEKKQEKQKKQKKQVKEKKQKKQKKTKKKDLLTIQEYKEMLQAST